MSDIPQFSERRSLGKKSLKDNERNSLHLAQKCALIYFSGRHLSWEAKTVNFKEQMTSADKCLQTASCAKWKLFLKQKGSEMIINEKKLESVSFMFSTPLSQSNVLP